MAMPGKDGRKMFMVSAEIPARSVSVTIRGGVARFRNSGGVRFMFKGYA